MSAKRILSVLLVLLLVLGVLPVSSLAAQLSDGLPGNRSNDMPEPGDGVSRFIVKYKEDVPQAAQSFESAISRQVLETQSVSDLPNRQMALSQQNRISSFAGPQPGDMELIVLDQSVQLSAFAEELRALNAGQYLDYIHPDYSQHQNSMSLESDDSEIYWSPSVGPLYLNENLEEYSFYMEYTVIPDQTVAVDLTVFGEGSESEELYFYIHKENTQWDTGGDCTANDPFTTSFNPSFGKKHVEKEKSQERRNIFCPIMHEKERYA